MKYGLFFGLIVLFFVFASAVFAGQGCCSWHDGECGCSATGRTVCCDGTLSPSCTCTPPNYTYQQPLNQNTQVRQQWCGSGNIFDTRQAAQADLQKAYDSIFQKGRASGFDSCHSQYEGHVRAIWILFWGFVAFVFGYFVGVLKSE